MSQLVLDRVAQHFGDTILASGIEHGHAWARVAKDRLVAVATYLRDTRELAMDMPIDCTAVDYLNVGTPRFDVVWHIGSMALQHRLRLRVHPGDESPEVPSLTPLWPGMNWHEREAWDLYGVRFTGHPNLRRVLMYEEFVGHPLRRDYPIDKRQPLVEMLPVRRIPTQRHAPPELLNRP